MSLKAKLLVAAIALVVLAIVFAVYNNVVLSWG